MSAEDIDPDNLPLFQLPENFLNKIFELTGDGGDKNRGFILGTRIKLILQRLGRKKTILSA